jgi:hypothetical protein
MMVGGRNIEYPVKMQIFLLCNYIVDIYLGCNNWVVIIITFCLSIKFF